MLRIDHSITVAIQLVSAGTISSGLRRRHSRYHNSDRIDL